VTIFATFVYKTIAPCRIKAQGDGDTQNCRTVLGHSMTKPFCV